VIPRRGEEVPKYTDSLARRSWVAKQKGIAVYDSTTSIWVQEIELPVHIESAWEKFIESIRTASDNAHVKIDALRSLTLT